MEMERHEHQSHEVKRVVLPSGKTIEVVYFKEAHELGQGSEPVAPAAAEAQPPADLQPVAEPHQDLHVCLDCGSPLVHPVEWEEAGPENWRVLLHCPNCWLAREGVFAQATVESFDEELDRGADALARDYRRLMRANMAEEVDRFVAALEVDAVLPEDFGHPSV
jgi:hypothetical protein